MKVFTVIALAVLVMIPGARPADAATANTLPTLVQAQHAQGGALA